MGKYKGLITSLGRECSRCGKYLEWNFFNKNSNTKTGYNSCCRDCEIKKRKPKRRHNNIVNDIGRECSICKKFKTWDNFYIKRKGTHGYSSECKECKSKLHKKYYKENSNIVLSYAKKYARYNPSYDTYASRLSVEESPRKTQEGYLEVKCSFCGKYFIPTNKQIQHRINALNGIAVGESRLYCSNECKLNCPVFGKEKYPSNFIKHYDRENFSKYVKNKILERDGGVCQICGSADNIVIHHIVPTARNAMFCNDIENGISLCVSCHKKIHSLPGCTYYEIRTCNDN